MNSSAISLYLYMNSSDEIIKWLESEGVKTKDQALSKLEPYVQSNMYSFAASVGAGNYGGSLAGTSGCIKKVIEYFEDKENSTK